MSDQHQVDDLRARIVSMTRQRDDDHDRWERVWLERDALLAALEHIVRVPDDLPFGKDQQAWEFMRAIARAALQRTPERPAVQPAEQQPMLEVRIYKGDDVIVDAKELIKFLSFKTRGRAVQTDEQPKDPLDFCW